MLTLYLGNKFILFAADAVGTDNPHAVNTEIWHYHHCIIFSPVLIALEHMHMHAWWYHRNL